MAIPKLSKSALFLLVLLYMAVLASARLVKQDGLEAGRQLFGTDCGGKCGYRCSKASRAKICLRDCTVCCNVCNCVPPGTAGNREVCPCYASLKNSKGTGKCP